MSSSNNSFNAFEQIRCTCSQRDKVTTPDMLQVGRGKRLCVHALPADMGVADFCSFVGAYLPSIREMRLVRREGGRTSCMVLLTFSNPATTDDFYSNFNNKPVRIEPCHGLQGGAAHRTRASCPEEAMHLM